MRRISFAFMSTLAAVIMLFGYRTSTPNPTSVATTTVAAAAGGSSTSIATTTPAAPSSTPTPTTSPSTGTTSSGPTSSGTTSSGTTSSGSKTITGSVVQTRWGPVQVQLTVTNSKVVSVTVLQQPTGNGKDVQINSRALPVLKQETLSSQSAQIDTVSGATVTSDGYITSLQSALDLAGL